jgi:hypothetical protein
MWLGYPLLLVYCTPGSNSSLGSRLGAPLALLVLLAAILLEGSAWDWPGGEYVAFSSWALLAFLGAAALRRGESRLGHVQVNGFLTTLALLCFPVGGAYVHDRFRRVTAANAA